MSYLKETRGGAGQCVNMWPVFISLCVLDIVSELADVLKVSLRQGTKCKTVVFVKEVESTNNTDLQPREGCLNFQLVFN